MTLRDSYTGKEDQDPDFSTGYTDFGARQYSPALRRWMTPAPLSEKYYGVSPYAFCNNNPVRYVDMNGMDWLDKVAGYGIGLFTDLVPGSGALRDKYTPNDPSDYNMALRDVDLTMLAVGESMTKAGGTMMAGGSPCRDGSFCDSNDSRSRCCSCRSRCRSRCRNSRNWNCD